MKHFLLVFSFLIFFLVGLFLLLNYVLPNLNPKTGRLSVNVLNKKADVLLDGKKIGTTPFQSSTLPIGDHKLEIIIPNSKIPKWKTNTTLSASTLSTIDLDLVSSEDFSSGESIYFRPGDKGATILTTPEGATILVNNKNVGNSPKNLQLETGMQTLTIKKEGYLPREVPITVEGDFKLSAQIYLAVDPFNKVTKLDSNSKVTFFALQNSYVNLAKDYKNWSEGIKHIQSTLGETQTKFDCLIDPKGNLYVLDSKTWTEKIKGKKVANVGYLVDSASTTPSEKASQEWREIKALFE